MISWRGRRCWRGGWRRQPRLEQESPDRARPASPNGQLGRVVIPKPILAQLGVAVGDSLELAVEAGRLVLMPVPAHPRAGWAEAARRIAEAGDDAPVWPEFSNEGGADLER